MSIQITADISLFYNKTPAYSVVAMPHSKYAGEILNKKIIYSFQLYHI